MSNFRPSRSFKVEQHGDRLKGFKPKPVRWSHQKELDELVGKKIYIAFAQPQIRAAESYSDGVAAVLRAADQFTISVEFSNKSVMTYFKYAILGYQAA